MIHINEQKLIFKSNYLKKKLFFQFFLKYFFFLLKFDTF